MKSLPIVLTLALATSAQADQQYQNIALARLDCNIEQAEQLQQKLPMPYDSKAMVTAMTGEIDFALESGQFEKTTEHGTCDIFDQLRFTNGFASWTDPDFYRTLNNAISYRLEPAIKKRIQDCVTDTQRINRVIEEFADLARPNRVTAQYALDLGDALMGQDCTCPKDIIGELKEIQGQIPQQPFYRRVNYPDAIGRKADQAEVFLALKGALYGN
ncbi:hypothetical protein H6504_00405 [Candidatus Woesearchaeota archaeon]|nr:hypothetical protein [Candidatus Woesearchaeota archaeon]